MFQKNKFSLILKEINNSYDSMTEFAMKASLDRTYISKYINLKLDNPPSPKILEKIAIASHGYIDYFQLMVVCGYFDNSISLVDFYIKEEEKFSQELLEKGLSNQQIKHYFSRIKDTLFENDKRNSLKKEISCLDDTIVQIFNKIFNDEELYFESIKINEKNSNIIDLDETDIAFVNGIKGLNDTNKMIIKNTIEALQAKQEKEENNKN